MSAMTNRRLAPLVASMLVGTAVLPVVASGQVPPPPGAPPAQPPPGPPQPTSAPPPPPTESQGPPSARAPVGQWVYTQQYGWIWMPFDDAYTYVPPGGAGEPLEYVYYPVQGWVWIAAPWVWGIGPWPYFGGPGPVRFAWYSHGWWRTPSRWRYRPVPEREGHASRGVRPAPEGRRAGRRGGGERERR